MMLGDLGLAGDFTTREEEIVPRLAIALVGAVYALAAPLVLAQDVAPERIRAAVERALPVVEHGLKTFCEKKTMPPVEMFPTLPATYRKAGCVSCHHEGFGLTTLSFLRGKGFATDVDLARRQADDLRRFY